MITNRNGRHKLLREEAFFVELDDYVFIASLKGEAMSDCAQGECRTFQSHLPVYVFVNKAARATLHVLNVIYPVPTS